MEDRQVPILNCNETNNVLKRTGIFVVIQACLIQASLSKYMKMCHIYDVGKAI